MGVHVCAHVHEYVNVRVCISMHLYTRECAHEWVCEYTCMCTCVCICTCVYTCACAYVHGWVCEHTCVSLRAEEPPSGGPEAGLVPGELRWLDAAAFTGDPRTP